MERGGKMSAPSTSSLSVELLSRVIDVKYGCFTFTFTFYPSGKLKTEFTSPIAKSASPGLLDTTFFLHTVPDSGKFTQ